MQTLQVGVLGGLQILAAGEPIRLPQSKVARSLLVYLLLHRDRPHSRSHLVGVFWPDDSETDARRKLSQNLWRIKTCLEPFGFGDLIVATGEDIQAGSQQDVVFDVEQFVRGASRGGLQTGSEASVTRLREAVALYRGDFMDGHYEDWVGEEQRRLDLLYMRALAHLVQALKATGSYEEALMYARMLTEHDPLREDAHQEVMRLCVLLRRPVEALQQFERLQEILFVELGTEPEPTTMDLFERIAARRGGVEGTAAAAGKMVGPVGVPFVGRRVERARGIDIIDQTIGGEGAVMLVEGDPGVGKTRFLEEMAEAARWRDVEVLWGSAPADATAPFGVVRSALAGGMTALRAEQLAEQVDPLWLTEVARVVPQLSEWLPGLQSAAPLPPSEGRDRMIQAITTVLNAFGRIGPHIIIFDDLHWADVDSIEVIRHMATGPALRRTSIFTAFRGVEGRTRAEVWRVLDDLDRAGASVLTLRPLVATESEQLVRWASGHDGGVSEAAPRIHEDTGGNPLFVIETARAMVESGGSTSGQSLPVTEGVRGLIAQRLGRLGLEAREVVGALAVCGVPASPQQLFQWSEVSRSDLLSALTDLVKRGLLVEAEAGYRFAHDQLRRVAYDLIPPGRRVRLHRVIAEALALSDVTAPSVLATHLQLADQAPRAFAFWVAAARESATVHAYATAAGFYESALECFDPAAPPAGLVTVLAEYERVLSTLGRHDRQAEVLDWWESVGAGDPRDAVEVQIRRSVFLSAHDAYDRAIELADEAIRQAEEHHLESHRARLAKGRALHWSGRTADAAAVLAEAAELAPYDAEIAIAHGAALGEGQRYGEARAALTRALEQSRLEADARLEAEALGLLALVAVEQGDSFAVEGAFREAIDACRAIGFTYGEAVNLSNRGHPQYFQGRIVDAIASYTGAQEAFARVGHQRGVAVAALNEASLRHQVLGDDARAETLVTASQAFYAGGSNRSQLAHCHELLGSISHRRGDDSAARRQLEQAIDLARAARNHWREGFARRTRAVVRAEGGDFPGALDDLTRARSLAGPDLAVVLDAYEGWVLAEMGDPRAWDVSVRGMRLLRTGIPMAWAVPYLHGRVAELLDRLDVAAEAYARAHELLLRALSGFDGPTQRHALTQVPLNAAIVERFQLSQPVTIDVRLARPDAPSGRPLRPDEVVDVTWHLERAAVGGPASDRQTGLVDLARQAEQQGGVPTVDDFAEALLVSRSTIKRDLAALRSRGAAPRTRGSR